MKRSLRAPAARKANAVKSEKTKRLPSYRRPPVAEVAAGVAFTQNVPNLLVAHVGLFWNRILRDFPHTQHFSPLIPLGGEPRWTDGVTGLPLPRVWFLSETKRDLIQLQGDCFYFNWRKLEDSDQYPRYPTIIGSFHNLLSVYLEFLKEHKFAEPTPALCELTYTNYIPQEEGWKSLQDMGSVFKDFCWANERNRFLPEPKGISWTCVFELPDNNGSLTAKLGTAARRKDNLPTLRLDLTAKGLGGRKSLSDIAAWFDIAHTWIVEGFTDLTTPKAQKTLWGREDA